MSRTQRIIITVAGVLMLIFAANEGIDYDGNKVLATCQFLAAIALFYWAARKG